MMRLVPMIRKETTDDGWSSLDRLCLPFLDNGRKNDGTGLTEGTGHGWVRVGGGDDFINFFYVWNESVTCSVDIVT